MCVCGCGSVPNECSACREATKCAQVNNTWLCALLLPLPCSWFACVWFFIHRLETNEDDTWAIADGLATFDAVAGNHNTMNNDVTPAQCLLRAWSVASRAHWLNVLSPCTLRPIKSTTPAKQQQRSECLFSISSSPANECACDAPHHTTANALHPSMVQVLHFVYNEQCRVR